MSKFGALTAVLIGSAALLAVPAWATSVSPSTLNFPSAPVGTRTNSYCVILTNNNTVPITSLSLKLGGADPGDFNLSSNCGTSLASGGSCTAVLYFRPTALGNRSASLTFMDSATDSPQMAALTGVGGAPVYVSEICDYFYYWQVGAWVPSPITFTNKQKVLLNIKDITIVGSDPSQFQVDMAETTCLSSLAAGSSCTIALYYAPTVVEYVLDYLEIHDDAVGSPQTSRLDGYGTAEPVTFTGSLSFARQKVGTTSNVEGVLIANSQSWPLNLSAPSTTGDFSPATASSLPCGSTIPPNLWCYQGVVFKPTATGTRTGDLTITDDANIPISVSLTGAGQ